VSFTPSGDTLLSGSDDRRIIAWNWAAGTQRYSFKPGHRNNIFQAQALPHTGERTIVSCAADGQ
ncbi:WD_REPEATS_REGION domain-containing protein, partial [Haematococcus lacustris]